MVILRLFLITAVLTAFSSAFDVYSELGFEDPIHDLAGAVKAHFDDEVCSVAPVIGEPIVGQCRHYHQCRKFANPSNIWGNCPAWKVCCDTSVISTLTCDRTVRKRVSYFKSDDSVASGFLNCGYTVQAVNKYICQMRIDFSTNMAQQDGLGNCIDEYITIEGGSSTTSNIRLCYINEKQHIYIHLDQQQEIKIQAKLSSSTSASTWKIKVTQLECPAGTGTNFALANHNWYERLLQSGRDSELIAPPGCVQYFTRPTATVYSFNSNVNQPAPPTMGANYAYDICFKRQLNSEGVSITFEPAIVNDGAIPSAIVLPGMVGGTVIAPIIVRNVVCTKALYFISYNPIAYSPPAPFKIIFEDLSVCPP